MRLILLLLWVVASFGGTGALADDALSVGWIAPVTGARAPFGEEGLRGARLAVEELSSKEGVRVLLDVEDSQGDPKRGVEAFRALAQRGRRVLVSQHSGVSIAVAPLANAEKRLLMAVATTTDRYSSEGDFTFRVNGTTRDEAESIANFLSQSWKKSPGRIGVVVLQDEYTTSLYANIQQLLSGPIGNAVEVLEVTSAETDVRTILRRLKGVRYLLLVTYQAQSGLILRQAREIGFSPDLTLINISSYGPDFLTNASVAAEGVYVSTFACDESHPGVVTYRARYNEDPTWLVANGYDAVMLLGRAFKKCGASSEPVCLRDTLFAVRNYHGMAGVMSFDRSGNMRDNATIMVVQNGRLVRSAWY